MWNSSAVTSSPTAGKAAAAAAEYDRKLNAARADVYAQLDETRRAALDQRARLLAETRQAVERDTQAATARVAQESAAARASLDREASDLANAIVARVLDRGTTSRSANAIADELDNLGAALSVVAGRHQLTVSATCLAEDFDAIFAMAADIVQHPTFDPREVETRRAELLTAILQDEDDPGAVAVDLAMSRLYPSHPYGRRPRGTTASVATITRELHLPFQREQIRQYAVISALDLLRRQLHLRAEGLAS